LSIKYKLNICNSHNYTILNVKINIFGLLNNVLRELVNLSQTIIICMLVPTLLKFE